MKKMSIRALAENHFKAPITVSFPTNEIDANGKTVFGAAKFVGLFRSFPVSELRKQMSELQALSEAGDSWGMLEMEAGLLEKSFIGFEPLPGEELPFLGDDDLPLVSNAAGISALLDSKEVREAINGALKELRDPKAALNKNLKK